VSESIGHFSLWGDFELEEVTSLLGVQPSQVYRKGDDLDGASTPALVSTWDLYCPDESNGSAGEQVAALLHILWPKREALRPLSSRFRAALNISVSCENGTDVLSLDHQILSQLVELNLELNCFYNCDEERNGN
jgi:hypothetical protein